MWVMLGLNLNSPAAGVGSARNSCAPDSPWEDNDSTYTCLFENCMNWSLLKFLWKTAQYRLAM